MNSYEAKRAARKAHYLERAEQARQEATAAWSRSSELAGYTLGAPILVGHHSEKRHRRVLETIRNGDRKAVMFGDKAEHYEAKAEAVGNGGISSDDPEALAKLRTELSGAETLQQRMKAANRLVRKGDWAGVEAMEWTTRELDFLRGRGGFPAYRLTNNQATVRRIAARITALEAIGQREDVEHKGRGYTYLEDTGTNRVMFEFSGKPNQETRDLLKRYGFRWSPAAGVWMRQLNAASISAGQWLRSVLDKDTGGGVAGISIAEMVGIVEIVS